MNVRPIVEKQIEAYTNYGAVIRGTFSNATGKSHDAQESLRLGLQGLENAGSVTSLIQTNINSIISDVFRRLMDAALNDHSGQKMTITLADKTIPIGRHYGEYNRGIRKGPGLSIFTHQEFAGLMPYDVPTSFQLGFFKDNELEMGLSHNFESTDEPCVTSTTLSAKGKTSGLWRLQMPKDRDIFVVGEICRIFADESTYHVAVLDSNQPYLDSGRDVGVDDLMQKIAFRIGCKR